ncbi:MAG: 3-dehydroquinate synthase [Rickettsiales bacterium]
MNTTSTLNVALGARSYPILIGQGLLAQAGALLRPHMPSERAIVISDTNVAPHYAGPLKASLEAAGVRVELLEIAAGEASKNFATLSAVMEALLALRPDRKTTIIALGGGVVGDLAGFAASILLRGVPFIQVPTTLLAQVDSSVGGKTAVNAAAGKNLIGSFYQPQAVLIDLATLSTLPRRELLAGYAEIIKYGLIMDAEFYAWCLTHGEALLAGDGALRAVAVHAACRMKAEIVAGDEREAGARALLNFGHTFGHALEAELGYDGRLLHGEAVAIGMVMACRLSTKLGLLGPEVEAGLAAHLAAVGLPAKLSDIAAKWDAQAIAHHFAGDKKTEGGQLNFVVLEALGQARVERNVQPILAQNVVDEFLV